MTNFHFIGTVSRGLRTAIEQQYVLLNYYISVNGYMATLYSIIMDLFSGQ